MRIKRILVALLLFTTLLTSIAGCGNSNAAEDTTNGTNTETNTLENAGDTGQNPQQSTEAVAMGRYVEEVTDLSDKIPGYKNRLFKLADGSVVITDIYGLFYISKDNGVTWEIDERPWLTRMQENKTYISDVAIGADNTAAVIYNENQDTAEQTEGAPSYNPKLLMIRPDGSEIPVTIPMSEDDLYPASLAVSDDGRIFVGVLGSSNLYEVKEDGSCDLFLTVQGNRPELIQIQGDLLIMDGFDYEVPIIYNMEKKEYIEDDVLKEFLSTDYKNGNGYSSDWYSLYFFPGEDGVLYLAGEKGLHRHVIGGSAIEQVIDGNLSTFGNPAYSIGGAVMLEDNEFLTIFSGSRLVRFAYDPDIPTVPNERLKVYSLKENDTIRQAISLYQTAHPEALVEYEIGMEKDSSITREDALKSLNTQIMAGEGPDVLVLDDLPLHSYIEKGLLLDLGPVFVSPGKEEELFDNLINAMKTDDKLYAMPCEIQVPAVMGKEKYVSKIKDLKSMADMIEEMRKDHPGKNLLYICSEKGIMRFFSMTCVPAWTTENGELDREVISEFLTQTKRIYDAQMDGLPETTVAQYNSFNESWMQDYGESRDDSVYLRTGASITDYLIESAGLVRSALNGRDGYADMISLNRVENCEDCIWTLMNGQSSNVFCAKTLLGISAASKQSSQAEDFIRLCFGKENQSNLFNGFAVNKAAFEESFAIDESMVDEDGAYQWISLGNDEGIYIDFIVYWPNEEQIAEIRRCIESLNTPYIEDVVLENAVYEAGIDYIQGRKSLEEAVNAIEARVSIYMAE